MGGVGSGLGRLPVEAVVAIPIQNEAERIERCLEALSRQRDAPRFEAVLFINNTTDATASVIQAMRPALTFGVTVVEHDLPPALQAAGHARRMAMEIALGRAPHGAALLCTDADGQVCPDWLAANLAHLRAGAEAVAGRATIDPVEAAAIPQSLHDADARECAYADTLDELDSLLDPNLHDPWPRHTEHSGASICVTTEVFRRVGGIPAVPAGEDRTFFDALRRVDARIRHACDVRVTVSGRLQGRAKGGMADTIRRRMQKPDEYLDDRLEPADVAWRRSSLRCATRAAQGNLGELRDVLGGLCRDEDLERYAGLSSFGTLWAEVERTCPLLQRRLVAVADLPLHMARAAHLRDSVKWRARMAFGTMVHGVLARAGAR